VTKKDANFLLNVLENEGFDYAFIHYSNFGEVKDAKFHELRLAYVKAHKELETYIDKCHKGKK
jgi:hypothetical protein